MNVKVFIFVLLSSTMLISCKPAPLVYENSSNEKIRHIFDPDQPRVEAPLTVIFTVAPEIELKRGIIAGVSMYMGTIPVVVEQVNATEWRAELWLGACSDPLMPWLLTIPWNDESTGTQGHYLLVFIIETN